MKHREFDEIIVVLGKRLNNGRLTAEGISRVESLARFVTDTDCSRKVIAFCGGLTNGQTVSEAKAMYDVFTSQMMSHQIESIGTIILEERSTNTIENVSFLAKEMIDSGLALIGDSINVRFLSNDYHLDRMFTIQKLMPNQGLLKHLQLQCAEQGLHLNIDYQLTAHLPVTYPHQSIRGQLFLLLDELTTYRVFLEGVCSQVFQGPISDIRKRPLERAQKTLTRMETLVRSQAQPDVFLIDQLPILQGVIRRTSQTEQLSLLTLELSLLDTILNYLNRYLDPERDDTVKWWR